MGISSAISTRVSDAKEYFREQMHPNVKKEKKMALKVMFGAQVIATCAVAFAAFKLLGVALFPLTLAYAGYNSIRIIENAKVICKNPANFKKSGKWDAALLNDQLKKDTFCASKVIEFATTKFSEKK